MDQILGILDENVFKCNHCGRELSSMSFLTSIALYGIIFLDGKDDGFIGIVCPNPECRKTTLQRRDSRHLYSWKNRLLSMAGTLEGSTGSRLRYYSVPYHGNYSPDVISQTECTITEELFNLGESAKCYDFPDDTGLDEPLKYPEGYCSYFLGDIAMGPAMEVLWYKRDSINELLDIENKTGRIVFPRYRFYDGLQSLIDDVCWEHFLRDNYVKSFNEGEPFIPLDVNMMNAHQRRIKATYDFMCILNAMLPDGFIRSLPSSFASVLAFYPPAEVPQALDGFDLEKDESKQIDRVQIQKMTADLWQNFTKPHIQKLLIRLFVRFVSAFRNLKQVRTSSCLSIWKLKEKALDTAHNSIRSGYARKKTYSQLTKKQREEVAEIEERFPVFKRIITQDYNLNELKLDVARVAGVHRDGGSFLFLGESGTGKELFAKAIHEASGRKGRFEVADCGESSESLFESELFGHVKGAFTGAVRDKKGLFELADGGTIFLDEIGNLPRPLQPKLLRVLQEHEIRRVGAEQRMKLDVRVVLATNRDLAKMVEEEAFMADLYQRFKRPYFQIPPLRERKEDIPLLVEHFIDKNDIEKKSNPDLAPLRVSSDCMNLLMDQDWKEGNVREVEKVIEQIMLVNLEGGKIRRAIMPADLPKDLFGGNEPEISSGKEHGKEKLPGNQKVTNDQLKYWMARLGNNKSAVARELGVTYKTIRIRWQKITL